MVVLQKTLFKVFHYLQELSEFNDVYPLPDIIRVIKTRRMSWACSTYRGEERCMRRFGGEI